MRAVVIDPKTGNIRFHDISIPLPGPKQVLIRVQSCSLNQVDLFRHQENVLRRHWQRAVPGIEVVGTISAFGEGCSTRFSIADRVFAMIDEGGLAEFAVADEDLLLPALEKISSNAMNAIPVAFMTAYHVCFISGRVQKGDVVLVHAAASSVGLAIVQLLSRREVEVIATIRSESKRQLVEEAGAKEVINISSNGENGPQRMFEKIRSHGRFSSVDVVLDCVGGDLIADNLKILKRGGRLIVFGMIGESSISDPALLQHMMEKDITLSTSNVIAQSIEHKRNILNSLETEFALFTNIEEGKIKITLDRVFPLDDIDQALQRLRAHRNIGKIVVLITSAATAVEEFEREIKSIQTRNRWLIHK